MMKYLFFSCFLLTGCASDYKALQTIAADEDCINRVRPNGLATAWYNAQVDVMGRSLSGLLIIKGMPHPSYRLVFTNEAGLKLFDFEFDSLGNFRVIHIIKQMDRKIVVNTLKDDFRLLLGLPFGKAPLNAWTSREEIFYGAKEKYETAYFITGKECASLRRLELGSKRKRKVSISFNGVPFEPRTITIRHHTFDMHITLTKIERE